MTRWSDVIEASDGAGWSSASRQTEKEEYLKRPSSCSGIIHIMKKRSEKNNSK